MTGWAGANYAARLDLEENSITRVKNVHIFNRIDVVVDCELVRALVLITFDDLKVQPQHYV